MKTLSIISATLALSVLAAPAGAQTLARLASPTTMLTLEMANFSGARSVAPGLVKDIGKLNLFGSLGLSGAEQRQVTDILSLADRDAMLAISLDATGSPHFLAAARVSATAGKSVGGMLSAAAADAKRSHAVLQKARAGAFAYTIETNRDGSQMAYGLDSGLVFVSDHPATLGDFLRNASGKGSGGLGGQSRYANVMNSVGDGQLRLYLNFQPVADMAGQLGDMGMKGLNLAPALNALAGVGQMGLRLRVTANGLESVTSLAPNAARDPALASLMLARPSGKLQAASVVPANVVSFSTSSSNINGLYGYLNALVDKTGLNPGGLDALGAQNLGLDLRKNLVAWMSDEIATASFKVNSKTAPLEAVYYLKVTDVKTAQAGLEASVPAIATALGKVFDMAAGGLGSAMGGTPGKAKPATATTVKATSGVIVGVPVTRWTSGSTTLVTAFQNNFLLVATSNAGMSAALAAGPRLTGSKAWTTLTAKLPANATAISLSDTATTLRTTGQILSTLGPAFTTGLSAGMGMAGGATGGMTNSTAAMTGELAGVMSRMSAFMNALANRAGTGYGWTVVSNGRVTSTSVTPMRW